MQVYAPDNADGCIINRLPVGAGFARPYASTWMFSGQANPAPTNY